MSTIGQRIASYRKQHNMSQKDLAVAVGRSESWVSQVERDIQPVERLPVLQSLAQALGITLQELRPDAAATESTAPAAPEANDLDGLRLVLSGHPAAASLLSPEASPTTIDSDELERAVDHAWRLTHHSKFADLTVILSDLLPRLEQASRTAPQAERPKLHRLRAHAYQAVAAAFARQDEADAAWLAADRAIAASELANEPLEVLAGHFRLAHAFTRLKRLDQSEHVASSAINALEPVVTGGSGTPEGQALCGALYLARAVVRSRAGDRAGARSDLDAADALGQLVGEGRNDFHTEFGPTNVQLHRVAICIELGDAGEALEIAEGVDASSLSNERQARFLVDVARARLQRRQLEEAAEAMVQADGLAPEFVRGHPQSRGALLELLQQFSGRAPAELSKLARNARLS